MEKYIQRIPTQEEALLMYLADRIIDTRGHIMRIKNGLKRLNEDLHSAQSREARMEFAHLMDLEAAQLENYEFRLDFLQTMLENAQNDLV